MDIAATADKIRAGQKPTFGDDSIEFAKTLDSQDSLKHLRSEYTFPTRVSLKSKTFAQGK